MAGVLPTPARDTGIGDLRLFAPPLNTSYVACRAPLFNAVVGMTHSIAEASQSRIVSPHSRLALGGAVAKVERLRARQTARQF